MRLILLFLFSYPLISSGVEDCWPRSPSNNFTTLWDNKHCNFTLTTTSWMSNGSFLSLEMINIGANESVKIFWESNMISNEGSSNFSFHQYIIGDTIISINTGASTNMRGMLFYSATNDTEIPVTQVRVSYGQEGFNLNPYYIYNTVGLPRKFEITADTKVALISVTDEDFCRGCTEYVSIYEGIGETAQYIGTASDINRKLWMSQGKTVTLYLTGYMDLAADDQSDASEMDVIANEAKNLEKCSFFDVMPRPPEDSPMSILNYSIDATGGGGACLTCWGRCYVQYARQFGNSDFYAYAGVPHPDPIKAGFVLDNYSQRNISFSFPQYFPGTYVTYYVPDGVAMLNFINNDYIPDDFVPYNGLNGFIQSVYYPFSSATYIYYYENSKLALSEVGFFYNITIMIAKTYEPVGSNASIEIQKKSVFFQKIPFDVNTNVGVPMTFQVAPYTYFEVILHDGDLTAQGSLITWNIGNVPTGINPTTKKPNSPKIGAANSFIVITAISLFQLFF